MDTLKALILNWLTPSGIWTKIDGWKAYGAGALAILTGLAGCLMSVAGFGTAIGALIAAHDIPGLIAFFKVVGASTDLASLKASWLIFLGGLATVGLRHAQDKAIAATQAAANPAPPTP